MNWWEWTLISIALYVSVGLIIVSAFTYLDGRRGLEFDGGITALIALIWPGIIAMLVPAALERVYKYGKGYEERQTARKTVQQEKRDQKETYIAVAKELGMHEKQLRRRHR